MPPHNNTTDIPGVERDAHHSLLVLLHSSCAPSGGADIFARSIGVALIALIVVAYALRPLGFIREPLMFVFVRYPALFWVPLVLTLLAAGVHVAVKMIFGDRYVAQSSHLRPSHLRRSRFEGTVITAAITAVTGLIAAMVIAPLLKLQFLVSVVPNAANRVALSVIVDAQTQQVTASFDADGAGDRALIAYLGGRGLDPEARLDAGVGDDPGDEVSDDADTDPDDDIGADAEADDEPLPLGDGAQDTLRRLLAQNRSEQRDADGRLEDLRAQERDLRRLLDSAEERY
jgi:hypothetical protein